MLKIPSLISKDQNENLIFHMDDAQGDLFRIPSLDINENIICTMDDVRGEFLGPPHGTTPAAVIANENKTEIL